MVLTPWSVGSSAGQQEDTVGAAVDAVLEAYGGVEQVTAMHSYRFEATMRVHVRGTEAAVVRVSEGLDDLEVKIHYPDHVEVRRLVQGLGWRSNGGQDSMQAVNGPMLLSMQAQAARASLPWSLQAIRDELELIDSTEEHILLGLRLPGEAAIRFFVDPATHRIVRSESLVGAGQVQMIFATNYSDFRDVDGVLFPFHEESWAQGTHTASTEVRIVQWNPSTVDAGQERH